MSGSFAKFVPLLGALLLLAFPAPSQGQCSLDFPHDSNPTRIIDEDICNFHQVDADLYRGGRPQPNAYLKLVEVGIRTIIDLESPESVRREQEAIQGFNQTLKPEARVDFIPFPIDPAEIVKAGVPHERLQDLFAQMQKARKPIFIHCYHGKDRTGVVVALYRMLHDQLSFQEAYDEAMHYGFGQGNTGLEHTLERYQDPKKLKSLPRP